jgi:Protein of unknown function (DUF1573)
MKHFIVGFIFCVGSILNSHAQEKISEKTAINEKKDSTTKEIPIARQYLRWEKDFTAFGKIKRGEKREFTYVFENISNEDIEILICSACDCTSLAWSEGVFKKGEKGELQAIFDSTSKSVGETLNITVILKNNDPVLHYPIVDEVKFSFEIE